MTRTNTPYRTALLLAKKYQNMNKTIPLTTEQALEAIRKRRADAMKWWISLPFNTGWELCVKHKDMIAGWPDRALNGLTGREIENIWRAETNQSQS